MPATPTSVSEANAQLDAWKSEMTPKEYSRSKKVNKVVNWLKSQSPGEFDTEAGGGLAAQLQRGIEDPTPGSTAMANSGFGIGDLSNISGVSGGFGGDIGGAIQSAIGMQQQAIQPAVESLEAQKSDLQTQYDTLLSDVLGREEQFQAQELGARGITPSSSLAQQTMTRALNPLQQQVSAAQSADTMAINNAIAQLQAQAGMSGISTGTDIYGMMAGLQQNQLAQQLAQQQQDLAQRQYEQVTLPQSQYELNRPYFKPETPTDYGAELTNFLSTLGLGGLFGGTGGTVVGVTPAGGMEEDFGTFSTSTPTEGIDFGNILSGLSNKQQKFFKGR